MPIFKSLVRLDQDKSPCRKRELNPAHEADALTTRPTRRCLTEDQNPHRASSLLPPPPPSLVGERPHNVGEWGGGRGGGRGTGGDGRVSNGKLFEGPCSASIACSAYTEQHGNDLVLGNGKTRLNHTALMSLFPIAACLPPPPPLSPPLPPLLFRLKTAQRAGVAGSGGGQGETLR